MTHTTDSTSSFDVLVAGASFAGLSLAIALKDRLGPLFGVGVVDRADPAAGRAQAGRASTISASSQRMLDRLGVWQQIAANAQPITRIEITDSPLTDETRPVLMTYANEVGPREAGSYVVPNEVLISSLRSRAADAGVTLTFGHDIRHLRLAPARATLVTAANITFNAPLVVAADGPRSRLRAEAGITTTSWPTEQTGIIFLVDHDEPHDGIAVQHFLPAGPIALLPMTGQQSCITWTEDRGEAKRILAFDRTELCREVELRLAGRLGRISMVSDPAQWPIEPQLADTYIAQRFALVGDAAHSVHPVAGQGLNLAFRDVAALTDVTADAACVGLDHGSLHVLRGYERWRRFDSTASSFAFSGIERLFSNGSASVRAVRDFGLGLVDRVPALKAALVREAAGLTGELPSLMR